MATTTYSYTISTDFANGVCYEDNLVTEIKTSSITTAFIAMWRNDDTLTISFVDALTSGEKTTLDGDTSNPAGGLIAAHNPTPVPETDAESKQIRTPPTFDAHQHNYNPVGFDMAGMVRISSTAAFNITGLLAGGSGRVVRIHNVGSFNITFKKENASSSAANRIASTADILVTPDSQISLQYDVTTSRWRALSGGGAAGDLVGNYPDPQVAQSSRAFGFVGVIEPAAIAADTNDYNPTGLSAANTIRLQAQSPGFTITGLVGGADGRVLFLYNAGNNPITLANDSASSAIANRFLFSGVSAMVLMPNQGAIIQFDATANRWRSPGSETSSELAGQVVFSGDITPTTLAGNTNNYNPTGLANAAVLRLSASTPGFDLTGIQGGLEGRVLILHNVGSFPITLKNNATSSTTYRFQFAADIVLSTDQSLALQYDSTVNRWRCFARQPDVYGSAANTICQGNDSRLSNSRTPTAHASTHQHGGSDEIATATAAANAIPKAGAGSTLAAPWLPTMVGDSGAGGTKGAVPVPGVGDATKFLRGDGTWVTVAGGAVLAQAVSTPNVIDDSLAQPPTITGTVSITNGSATVTGTTTAFTTDLAVGMVIRFNAQTGTNYTILSIASNTSLTLTANYGGTTNASTTLRGVRESDAYIVSTSPAGDWSTFAKGDLVVWTGSAWTKLLTGTGSAPATNTTVLVTAFQGTAAGAFAGQSGKIGVYNGAAWAFTTPTTDHRLTVIGLGDPLEGATALYRLTSATWAITAPGFRLTTLTGSNTTTSTSDTVTGMGLQLVPAAGVYAVEFFGGSANSGTGSTATCIHTPYAAGAALTTAISRTKATSATNGGTNISGFYGAATGVVLNGVQNVEGRWKVGASTGTRYEVGLKIRRIR